jgi:hypothetical protein
MANIPVNTRCRHMQRSISPREVLICLISGIWGHVVGPIQSSKYFLDASWADIIPTHQVVDQLIVVAPRAYRATHFVCFAPVYSKILTTIPQLIELVTSQLFFNIIMKYSFQLEIWEGALKKPRTYSNICVINLVQFMTRLKAFQFIQQKKQTQGPAKIIFFLIGFHYQTSSIA